MPFPTNLEDHWIDANAIRAIGECWGLAGTNGGRAALRVVWGDPVGEVVAAASDTMVKAIIFEYPNAVIWLFAGCDRFAHVERYLLGMLAGNPPVSAIAACNTYVLEMGDAMIALANANNITKTKPQILCGHSLGGCLATVVGIGMLGLGQWNMQRIITYGAPKPGTERFCSLGDNLNIVRWMNENDPVPHIYPDRNVSVGMYLATGVAGAIAGAQQTHTRGGAVLHDNGNVLHGDLPPIPGNAFDGQLHTWFMAVSGRVNHPHHASSYWAKLSAYAALFPAQTPVVPPRTNNAMHTQPPPTQRQERALNREDVRQVVDGASNLPSRGYAASFKWFEYRKEEELYNVYFLGKYVCSYKMSSKAKKCCSGGNKFIANYLRSPIGAEDQLLWAMENFVSTLLPE